MDKIKEVLDLLIVEDDVFLQRIQSTIFRVLGHNVFIVGSGQEAIEFLNNYQVDLIIMDLIMPNMNGFEATTIIRSKNIRVPIYALSGNDSIKDRQEAFSVGMNAYFTKPLNSMSASKMIIEFNLNGVRSD